MPKLRKALVLTFLVFLVFSHPALAVCPTSTCFPDGTQSNGIAKYRVCMPDRACWNGKLVVYAHGYVAFNQPIEIPDDQLIVNGVSIPELVNKLGYGFAVSSYSANGLAILPAVQDLQELVNIFGATVAPPAKTYLVGPSEGGLVAALSMEQLPQVYNAGLPACGPIGDFQKQLNYIGDFRVVFDYFFPGVIPGSPISIPQQVIDNWEATYVPAVEAAIQANPAATAQLLNVTRAPVGLDPSTVAQTVTGLLWYNVFGANDARIKLGGQPFDNRHRIYTGSQNDVRLNLLVERFSADPAALQEVAQHYQTTGRLADPVVTMHTTGDPIIPYWHEPFYTFKTFVAGSGRWHSNIPVLRYGHCNFTAGELLLAFGLMVLKDSGQALAAGAESVLPPSQRQEFLDRARQHGLLGR